jgi:hypothetical protein
LSTDIVFFCNMVYLRNFFAVQSTQFILIISVVKVCLTCFATLLNANKNFRCLSTITPRIGVMVDKPGVIVDIED